MKFIQMRKSELVVAGLALVLAWAAPSVRANVYATNLKLNGGTGGVTVSSGQSIDISYILNEPATAGVTVNIAAGSKVMRSLVLPANAPGTSQGSNTITWDGLDNGSNAAPAGTYSVSVTAATTGYQDWTQITDDQNPLNYVFESHGIAVNQNPASPYYGRIYVVNAVQGIDPNRIGDPVGMYLLNADATQADGGGYSDGGIDWNGLGLIPWKAQVSADDSVYVSDAANGGAVYRWDPAISPGAQAYVLRADNQTADAVLGGLAITGTGTNTLLWMTASNAPDLNQGILRWTLTANGTCASNDLGSFVVSVGTNSSLTLNPMDVALDKAGNIYTCQSVGTPGDPTPRVFRFPAYSGGPPEQTATWAVGGTNDEYGQATGIAVDPTGTYVAVSFLGINGFGLEQGNTKVLYATNGGLVANLDLNVTISGQTTHQDTACAWDAVGNVYYIDNWLGRWRTVSPPGPNQSTTVALGTLQVTGSAPSEIRITNISISNQVVIIDFTGSTADSFNAFTLLGAPTIVGPYSPATGAIISSAGPGLFRATVPVGTAQYYRIVRGGSVVQETRITNLTITNQTVTIDFTGSPTDTVNSFTLLSAPTITGSYSSTANAVITSPGPGLFRATAPASSPSQFYRILKGQSVSVQPHITNLLLANQTATISFTGSTADTTNSFTLLSASAVNGNYSPEATAVITSPGPGLFQATAPASGPMQFYRIRK